MIAMVSKEQVRQMMQEAGKRAGRKAVEKLEEILEEKAREIVLRAKTNANFAGRRTIREEDIRED